jgi:phosphatidate cytidylyltransferase
MKELLTRSVTGLLFVAAFVVLLLWFPSYYPWLLMCIVLLAFYELHDMFPAKETLVLITLTTTALGIAMVTNHAVPALATAVGIMTIWSLFRPALIPITIGLVFFVLMPVTIMHGLIVANAAKFGEVMLTFFVVVWTNDTFAYIGGKLLGRHKLAPAISPGKTIEGSIIGIIIGTLTGCILASFWLKMPILESGVLAAIICVAAIWGDLTESALKRVAGVKNSGNLLPGHGGILDRIDASFGAFPVSFLAYHFIFGS